MSKLSASSHGFQPVYHFGRVWKLYLAQRDTKRSDFWNGGSKNDLSWRGTLLTFEWDWVIISFSNMYFHSRISLPTFPWWMPLFHPKWWTYGAIGRKNFKRYESLLKCYSVTIVRRTKFNYTFSGTFFKPSPERHGQETSSTGKCLVSTLFLSLVKVVNIQFFWCFRRM